MPGGSFANGAVTAAMGYAFNQVATFSGPGRGDYVNGKHVLNDRDSENQTLVEDGSGGLMWLNQGNVTTDAIHSVQSGTTIGEYTNTTDAEIATALTVTSMATGAGSAVALWSGSVRLGVFLANASGFSTATDFMIRPSGQTSTRLAIDGVAALKTVAAPPQFRAMVQAGNVLYDGILFVGSRIGNEQ